MEFKDKLFLGFISIVLLACIVVAGNIFLNGYRQVDGHVVGNAYTAGSDVNNGIGIANGQPAQVVTISTEKYTLMIDVDGRVNSYEVSAELYTRVLAGQTTVKMRCNDVVCAVVE